MTPVGNLTPQQSRVLAGLLSGETIGAAARNHGVHRAAIHNWLRDGLRCRTAMSLGRARLQTALYDDAGRHELRQNSTPATPGRNQPCPCNSGRKFEHCCLGKPQPQPCGA